MGEDAQNGQLYSGGCYRKVRSINHGRSPLSHEEGGWAYNMYFCVIGCCISPCSMHMYHMY